jgi:hypothetical protein
VPLALGGCHLTDGQGPRLDLLLDVLQLLAAAFILPLADSLGWQSGPPL